MIWLDPAKPGSAPSASQIPHAQPIQKRVRRVPKTRDTAFRFPAAEKRLAVDAGSHVADHVGLHWIVLAANACIALRLVSTFFLLRLVDKLDRHLRGSGCFQCFEAGIDLSQFDQPARMTKIFIEYG